jgi:hypothetical protein
MIANSYQLSHALKSSREAEERHRVIAEARMISATERCNAESNLRTGKFRLSPHGMPLL